VCVLLTILLSACSLDRTEKLLHFFIYCHREGSTRDGCSNDLLPTHSHIDRSCEFATFLVPRSLLVQHAAEWPILQEEFPTSDF